MKCRQYDETYYEKKPNLYAQCKIIQIFYEFQYFKGVFFGYLPFRRIQFRQKKPIQRNLFGESYFGEKLQVFILFHLIKLFLIYYYYQISINNVY